MAHTTCKFHEHAPVRINSETHLFIQWCVHRHACIHSITVFTRHRHYCQELKSEWIISVDGTLPLPPLRHNHQKNKSGSKHIEAHILETVRSILKIKGTDYRWEMGRWVGKSRCVESRWKEENKKIKAEASFLDFLVAAPLPLQSLSRSQCFPLFLSNTRPSSHSPTAFFPSFPWCGSPLSPLSVHLPFFVHYCLSSTKISTSLHLYKQVHTSSILLPP